MFWLMSRWQWLLVGFVIFFPAPLSLSQPSSPAPRLKSNPALTVTGAGDWKALQKGIEYRKLALERAEPSHTIELKVLRFDPRRIGARILRSGDFQLAGANVKLLVQKSGAVAAVNANYFDERGRPLGFLKVSAREINRTLSKSELFSGVFGVRDFSPFIVPRDEFQPSQADEALQCGPLLMSHGTPVEVTRGAGRFSRRAVIGIDEENRILIGVTDAIFGGLSWTELQELFAAPPWRLGARDLLNLDGGGSAQLYVKAGNFEEMVAGTSEVPVAIGFFNK